MLRLSSSALPRHPHFTLTRPFCLCSTGQVTGHSNQLWCRWVPKAWQAAAEVASLRECVPTYRVSRLVSREHDSPPPNLLLRHSHHPPQARRPCPSWLFALLLNGFVSQKTSSGPSVASLSCRVALRGLLSMYRVTANPLWGCHDTNVCAICCKQITLPPSPPRPSQLLECEGSSGRWAAGWPGLGMGFDGDGDGVF